MFLDYESVNEIHLWLTTQMIANEQFSPMVLFIFIVPCWKRVWGVTSRLLTRKLWSFNWKLLSTSKFLHDFKVILYKMALTIESVYEFLTKQMKATFQYVPSVLFPCCAKRFQPNFKWTESAKKCLRLLQIRTPVMLFIVKISCCIVESVGKTLVLTLQWNLANMRSFGACQCLFFINMKFMTWIFIQFVSLC